VRAGGHAKGELDSVFKVPRSVFQDGPPAVTANCYPEQLQDALDLLFSLLHEIRVANDAFDNRVTEMLSLHKAATNKVVVEI
jgi:hypothetical protein